MEKLLDYLSHNIATSTQISKVLNISAMSVSRAMRKLGNKVVKIPNGRSPLYALTSSAFNSGDSIHIWDIDEFGKATHISTLRPLAAGGFFINNMSLASKVLLGVRNNGLYEDLPYFLYDMAPQGFLGKRIAQYLHAIDESYPTNPEAWSNEHIGKYLLSNSENVMGNLQFGNNYNLKTRQSFEKFARVDYPQIATTILDSDINISSAGGEHQKFTTYCHDTHSHVIVKFSPKGDSEIATRWKDILITEYHANKVINQSGAITAATSEIILGDNRVFLESERFDRSGEYGRRSMISLLSIASEFSNPAETWVSIARDLHAQTLISTQDLFNIEVLWYLGRLIHNTDKHNGNLSLAVRGDGFSLLPIYDMCSMGFAPKGNGEVMPFKFTQPDLDDSLSEVKKARLMANAFWQSLYEDPRISAEFRAFIALHLRNKEL